MPAEHAVVIYHNPRCSKSRQTLALLQAQGIAPEIVEYLKSPPSKQQLDDILKRLNLEPQDFMRRQETAYKTAGLADNSLNRDDLLKAMVDNPILIERPIVLANGKAAIGRPPEQVLEILT